MQQSAAVIEGLKRLLRARNISYSQLGHKLEISETSVKRIFSEKTFTLERVEKICNILDITFMDLMRVANISSKGTYMEYSLQQEEYLSSNPKIHAAWYFMLNGFTVQDLKTRCKITAKEITTVLRRLDDLKLIEWQPGDKIKLLVDRETRWRKNGPLQKKYYLTTRQEFLNSSFTGENEMFRMMSLAMTPAQVSKAITQWHELIEEWIQNSNIEREVSNKPDNVAFLFAVRPFMPSSYSDFLK